MVCLIPNSWKLTERSARERNLRSRWVVNNQQKNISDEHQNQRGYRLNNLIIRATTGLYLLMNIAMAMRKEKFVVT